jgi:hypothetical protein
VRRHATGDRRQATEEDDAANGATALQEVSSFLRTGSALFAHDSKYVGMSPSKRMDTLSEEKDLLATVTWNRERGLARKAGEEEDSA